MPCQTSQTRQQRRWQQQCPSGGGAAGGSGAGAGRSLPARALATAAAGASAGAGANAELDDAALERIEELVDSELWAAGVEAEFDPAGRRDLVAAAVALHAAGAGARWATAAVLGAPWGSVTADLGAALADKVSRYLRWASQEPGAADDLVQALVHGDCLLEVAALPPEAFEANLQFVAAQLPRLGRRQYQALNEPYSLARWVQLNPETAGAVLLAGAASFGDTAVPWLREQLGWGEGEIAGAALSGHLPALCALPTPHAQRCLAWLCAGAGLTQLQAGQLLAADVALLAGGDADLASRQGWAERELLSPADGVGSAALAAALCLAQPPQHRSGGVAQRTRRLAALLQGTVGMSEDQQLAFVLGGGLDGGATLSEPALDRCTDRLKQLLLVYGSWPAVAAALAAAPEALHLSWSGLGSSLLGDEQRAAWERVTALQQQQEGALG